jgi:hypothetical protein
MPVGIPKVSFRNPGENSSNWIVLIILYEFIKNTYSSFPRKRDAALKAASRPNLVSCNYAPHFLFGGCFITLSLSIFSHSSPRVTQQVIPSLTRMSLIEFPHTAADAPVSTVCHLPTHHHHTCRFL